MAFDLLPRLNYQVWKLRKNPRGPETNSKFASENGWLEDEISFPMAFPMPFAVEYLVGMRYLPTLLLVFDSQLEEATGFFVIFVLRNFGEINSERFTMTGLCRNFFMCFSNRMLSSLRFLQC